MSGRGSTYTESFVDRELPGFGDSGWPQHANDGPCTEQGCACSTFLGTPYYEHAYSDKLLLELLKVNLPEEFGDRSTLQVELSAIMDRLDWDRLPDAAVVRIANKEHPLQVLLSLAQESPYVRELLNDGAPASELGPIPLPDGKRGE